MTHDEFESLIATALAGGLFGDEVDAFEQHKAECATCAQALAEAAEFESGVASIAGPAKAPADLEDRLVASFRAAAPKPHFSLTMTAVKVPGWLWKTAACAVAAGGLIMIGNYAEPGAHNKTIAYTKEVNSHYAEGGGANGERAASAYGESVKTSLDGAMRFPETSREESERKSTLDVDFSGTIDQNWVMRENLAGNTTDRTGKLNRDMRTDGFYSERSKNPSPASEEVAALAYKPADLTVGRYALGSSAVGDFNVQLGGANVVADPEAMAKLSVNSSAATGWTYMGNDINENGRLDQRIMTITHEAEWAKKALEGAEVFADNGATVTRGSLGTTPITSVSESTIAGPAAEREKWYAAREAEARTREVELAGAHERVMERLFTDKTKEEEPAAISTIPTVIGGTTTTTPQPPVKPKPKQDQPEAARKIVRNAALEFEVDVYMSAYKRINEVARETGGYLAGEDTQKLPNGKVRGNVTIRVPAENFDRAVDMLRALGDLKSQSVVANDVTKSYVDLESRIRNAQAMEERLLAILKDPKGETKDVMQVEKELAATRGQIEQMTGELKFMANLVAYSTISLTLGERDLATPFEYVETQVAAIDVVALDLDAAFNEARKIASELKGRLQEAKLNRPQTGAASATMKVQIDSDKFHEAVARLKKLGVVLVATEDLRTTASGGTTPSKDAKVRREAGVIDLVIGAPREATTGRANLVVTSKTVEKIYDDARKLVEAAGELKDAKLVRASTGSTATIVARVETAKFLALISQIKGLGDVLDESVDTVEAGLRSPSGEPIPLKGFADLTLTLAPPRDAVTAKAAVAITSETVDDDYAKAKQKILEVGGEILDAQHVEGSTASISAKVPHDAFKTLVDYLKTLGVHADATVNAAEGGLKGPDGKFLPVKQVGEIRLTIAPPIEAVTARAAVAVTSKNVDDDYVKAKEKVRKADGEILDAQLVRAPSGSVGTIAVKIPYDDAFKFKALVDDLKSLGDVVDATVNAAEGDVKGPDGKVLPVKKVGEIKLTIAGPREVISAKADLRVEAVNVDGQYAKAREIIEKAGGTIEDAQLLRQSSGATGTIIAKVKREDFARVIEALKGLGEVKDISVNAVEGGLRGPTGEKLPVREFGTFRFVAVSPSSLVESGSFQRTLQHSMGGVMWSLEKLLVGLGYVAVWIVPVALVWWIVKRRRKAVSAAAAKP